MKIKRLHKIRMLDSAAPGRFREGSPRHGPGAARRRISFASRLLLALLTAAMPSFAAVLVKDGKPVATIVISREALNAKPYTPGVGVKAAPAQKVRLAAEDLQRYVEKISGAKLPIVGEEDATRGPVVLVGASKKTDPLKLNIPSGLTTERREEGYLIVSKGDTLVLAGNDQGPYQGTFFSVSEFLNRQGVRWFMPGEFGEYVPKLATIEVRDVEFRDKPDFIVRSWNGNLAPELRADDAIWRLHNKLVLNYADILAIPGDGYLRKYMPDRGMTNSHPQYFARKLDGSIDPTMVNLTHPEVPKFVAEKIKAAIKKARETDPTFNSLGFAPDDGNPMDLSKETMATNLGFADLCGREGVASELSISEEWFRFMNKVVEEVVREYPDFIITSNGYTNRTFPPEGVKLHPNLGVMFAAIWADLLHAFDDPKSWQQVMQGQMLKRWGEICPRVFVYNYNFPMLVTGLTPMPMTRKIARNTPLMKKWGIVGFEDEQTFPWMAHGITSFYLRSRLYWRATADAKAILNDYFEKWYGPAARPSQAYWEAIEETLESTPILGHEDRVLPYVYTDKLIASLEKSESEAEALAKEEPYKTRVRVDRLILEHLKGYMAMNRAEFTGRYAEAIKQADFMFKQREELNKISGYFSMPESKDPRRKYFAGSHWWNLTQRKEHYQKLLDMLTGKTGDLIVQAPRKVAFSLDHADVGRIGRWYDPGFDRSKWRTIDTATPFYLQGDGMLDERGVPYLGFMWYIFELEVPTSAIGKPIRIHAPIVVTEAWVWTNGEYTGHRPYAEAYLRPATVDFDVTQQIKAGRNVIGVRVSTSLSRVQVAEGFQAPLFLYSPKSEAAAPSK
ncbi:MAG: DUF4838 domain-containing protein [Verrucomicrobiae bacterium]|nr:DUF4838 domain-containing protein [Verrucomicrobiae bacterium]